jgi:hypothetical protein
MVEFQDGVLEKEGYVEFNGAKIKVHMPKYTGKTPISAENLNKLQRDLKKQINSLASGSPLVASSVDEMTDTTRVYVNTTDGNWYYYNGTIWEIGGVYQATEIADNSICLENLNSEFSDILKNNYNMVKTDYIIGGYYRRNGEFSADTLYSYCILDVNPGEKYYMKGYTISNMAMYLLLDNENNVVSSYPAIPVSSWEEVENTFIIPANVVKMVVNTSNTVQRLCRVFKNDNVELINNCITYEKLSEDLKSNYKEEYEEVDLSSIEYVSGYCGRNGIVSENDASNQYYYKKIPVSKGEKYKVTGYSYINIPAYVLTDCNNRALSNYPSSNDADITKYEDLEVSVEYDNCYLYIHKIRNSESALEKKTRTVLAVDDYKNPLYGKSVVFDGDSICNGGSAGINGYGWAGRIGTKNNMNWKNCGIGGGTVTTDTYSYTQVDLNNLDWTNNIYYIKNSNATTTTTTNMYISVNESEWNKTDKLYTRGNARHWESTYIETIYNENPNVDYLILESCLNDGFNSVPKGSVISGGYNNEFETTTFAGAMEHLLQRAITLFPNAKIGMIIPHRVTHSMNDYHEITREACKKWSIPFIDLYYKSGLCVNNNTQSNIMFSDGSTHLTDAGYDFITPKIEAWMKSL